MKSAQRHFSFAILVIAVLLLCSACQSNSDKGDLLQESQMIDGLHEELHEEADEQPASFVNYDELTELARRVTEFTGVEYSNEELERMEKEDWRKNLEDAVQDFAEDKLHADITFMQSVPGTYNSRSVVIGGTSGDVYRVDFVKRHNNNGIWTAAYYGIVSESNASKIYEQIDYNIIRLEEADATINCFS